VLLYRSECSTLTKEEAGRIEMTETLLLRVVAEYKMDDHEYNAGDRYDKIRTNYQTK
jgi:hypothetical protein